MKVINKTLNDLEVQVKGVKYVLPANSHLDNVNDEHARYWKDFLHSFIELKKDDKTKETEVTTREEVVAELGEAEVAQIEEEAEVLTREEVVEIAGEEEVARIEAEVEAMKEEIEVKEEIAPKLKTKKTK
jgi:hypothetical protein